MQKYTLNLGRIAQMLYRPRSQMHELFRFFFSLLFFSFFSPLFSRTGVPSIVEFFFCSIGAELDDCGSNVSPNPG